MKLSSPTPIGKNRQLILAPIMYIISMFVCICFNALGLGLEQFYGRAGRLGTVTNCIFLWGERYTCYSGPYDHTITEVFAECPRRRVIFQTIAGLSVVSTALFTTCFVLAIVAHCCKWSYYYCMGISAVNIVISLVPWALLIVVTYQKENDKNENGLYHCTNLKYAYRQGPGFVFIVGAFVMGTIATFFLLIPY